MKLQFKTQDFQTDAVNAVVDLFSGIESNTTTFSITQDNPKDLLDFGSKNIIPLADADVLANMQRVQRRNKLQTTAELAGKNFCVEMETGTGKTYVYTKTIFELHKRYGLTKFIIVVPSVAIREGVYKSLQVTEEHFAAQYDGVSCRYFIYDSKKLSDVRTFSASNNIEIMIINIDAFRKAENIINQDTDKLNGETAMSFIQNTNPIVIIDEPQSVANTPKAKEAIASLNPLCIFRYSATHREKINTLYRLTPVDAYEQGLVKQIIVSSNTIEHDFNKPYIRLIDVKKAGGFTAKIELDIRKVDGTVERKTKTVKPHDDLEKISGGRELYAGYVIDGFDVAPGRELVEFKNGEVLKINESIGLIDEMALKRAQIRRTIEAHLTKELDYYKNGIKVLSLFFIDRVEKYRTDTGDNGIYAQIFEECYAELMTQPRFAPLKNYFPTGVDKAHDGYFSQDKRGNYKDTRGDTADDHNTYNTIMRDKEWLLSFECPLRFIFSHSALKEGWDNPNVFQVCTLIDQKSTLTARQKIGRGLRLCVNQNGERIEDKEINLLHVMANESFGEFASNLQREIEQETGVRFGVLQISMFEGETYEVTMEVETVVAEAKVEYIIERLALPVAKDETPTQVLAREIKNKPEIVEQIATEHHIKLKASDEKIVAVREAKVEHTISTEEAAVIMDYAVEHDYVTKSGDITDNLRKAIRENTLDLPEHYVAFKERFVEIVQKADRRPTLRNQADETDATLKSEIFDEPEFIELWSKIAQKTKYELEIDDTGFMRHSAREIRNMDDIPTARIVTQDVDIHVAQEGVSYREGRMKTTDIDNSYSVLPDVLTVLATATRIPRNMIYKMLSDSGRIRDFLRNPQLFIERTTEILLRVSRRYCVDGITYLPLSGNEYVPADTFEAKQKGNKGQNAVAVRRSLYDFIVCDSGVEMDFAEALSKDTEVKLFFKLPRKFKIATPADNYTPDWAVYLEQDGTKRICFIIETKGSTDPEDLRTREDFKIACGKAHFAALGQDGIFRLAKSWSKLKTVL